MHTVSPGHPRWDEFLLRLEGPEGINIQQPDPKDPNSTYWYCAGDHGESKAKAILERMGFDDAEILASMQYYRDHGGYCDCEILMNVDRPR